MSIASADSQPTAGQGSELDQPSPKWPSSWPQTQQRDQLRLPKPGPQTWERRSNASYCMPVRFGDCLLCCIIVAVDNWYRSGWLVTISSHVPIADRIQSTPCHYYHLSPLSCYPPSSEFISPPPTPLLPLRPKWFSAPHSSFPATSWMRLQGPDLVWRNTALALRLSFCWSPFPKTFDSGTATHSSGLTDISVLPLEKPWFFQGYIT